VIFYILACGYKYFKEINDLQLAPSKFAYSHPEDERQCVLRNIGTCMTNYTGS
jgi:hypothetical protein